MTPKKWSRIIKPDVLPDGLMLLMGGAIVMSCATWDQNAAAREKNAAVALIQKAHL